MAEGTGQRIDKWLFFARVVKSRSLAQKLVQSGAVRINRDKTTNAARLVRPDDTLTVSIHEAVRILKIRDCGTRRGPASEAAELYEDLSPPEEKGKRKDDAPPKGGYTPPKRPPNKKERRAHERLRWG